MQWQRFPFNLYEFILRLYLVHMIGAAMEQKKVAVPILTCAYPQFYLSLFLSPGTPCGESKKDGEEKENETESDGEQCLLSSGGRGHSVPQTFRQINLMRRLENSGEARSLSQKNHTQHPPQTVDTHAFAQTNTQAFFFPLILPLQINKHTETKNKTELSVRTRIAVFLPI